MFNFPSTSDFEKISASLVAPAHYAAPIPVWPVHPVPVLQDSTDNDNTHSEGSDVETEKEWLDEAQLTELTQRFPFKVSEAMVIEVHPFFFFDLRLINVCL